MTEHLKPILLFDWDGTIVDSNSFKWGAAWQRVFADNSEAQHAMTSVLSRPDGKLYNRWELIRETLVLTGVSELSGVSGSELHEHPLVALYARAFAQTLEDGLLHMQPFEGAKETLEQLYDAGYVMYVITNSVPSGVEMQMKHFALSPCKGVYGLPKTKYENFLEIAAREGVTDPNTYVCIGDGEHDMRLAEKIGCRFIGIANEHNGWGTNTVPFQVITTIAELRNIL